MAVTLLKHALQFDQSYEKGLFQPILTRQRSLQQVLLNNFVFLRKHLLQISRSPNSASIQELRLFRGRKHRPVSNKVDVG
jgi:hypothetical protein